MSQHSAILTDITTKNDLDKNSFTGKRARPVPNSEVVNFIDEKINAKFLYDDTVLPSFVEEYYEWIQKSKLNNLNGLDKYTAVDFVHGTSQAFDFFYMSHNKKRFRCLRGDYVYHKVSWQNYFDWCYLDEDDLRPGDALVISVPFSDYGSKHPLLGWLLDGCDELDIPVLLDCAYYCISRDLYLNVDRPCIDTITFSMSKAFYGMERLRAGIRCRNRRVDDGAVLINDFHCVSKIAAGVGIELCRNFEPDYNQNKYRNKQIEICNKLDLELSNCVLFGLTDKNHPKYGVEDYNRGTDWRRVCLSTLLGDMS